MNVFIWSNNAKYPTNFYGFLTHIQPIYHYYHGIAWFLNPPVRRGSENFRQMLRSALPMELDKRALVDVEVYHDGY